MDFRSFVFPFIFSVSAFAVTFEVRDPCRVDLSVSDEVVFSLTPQTSVGKLTIAELSRHQIPFQGSEAGISSMFNTPVSDTSVDVVSDQELFAYGWCYHFNGTEPGLMPNEIMLKNETDHILWFFSFSHYLKGEWVSMCTPAYTRPLNSFSAKYCPKK